MTTKEDKELLASIGLTPEQADRKSAAYESDSWDARGFGAPRRGRPSIADEEVRPYTVRFPVSLMEYVDEAADEHGHSRSEELRRIVIEARRHAASLTRQ